MVTDLHTFSELIGMLYHAASECEAWEPVARKIADALDAPNCVISARNPRFDHTTIVSTAEPYPPSLLAEYTNYYYRLDEWFNRASHFPMGLVFGSDDLISDADFEKTEFYSDWCRPRKTHYLVCSAIDLGVEAGLGTLSIYRDKRGGLFEAGAKRNLELLLPHLQQAMKLSHRLSGLAIRQQITLNGLERTGVATIAVDRLGRILYTNRQAEALLGLGFGLRDLNGRLVSTDREISDRLASLIRAAADTASGAPQAGPGGGIAVQRDESRLPLTLLIAPFRLRSNGLGAAPPMAAIFIRDPELDGISTQILQDLFALTPAQACVATRLSEGNTLAQVAASLRITIHTARDHLKVVFAKTGTSQQSQMVALVARTVAGLTDQ